MRALLIVCIAALSVSVTSCGGGGNVAAKPMTLIEFLIVDEALRSAAPTGALSLARNARLLMVFSELVNPPTVTTQTVQVRYGESFNTTAPGSFRVIGNQVVFDPTIDIAGQPTPFGFRSATQHRVHVPGFDENEGEAVIENLDFDPNLVSFTSTFTTGDGFLHELVPPTVERVYFLPARDELTRNVPGNGIMAFEFSEAMNPISFIPGAPDGPTSNTTLDVRYNAAASNVVAGQDGRNVPGTFSFSQDARTAFFVPTFSFGDSKLVFFAEVFQGVEDLSGNLLVNPGSFGPYTCDGDGDPVGRTLEEHFDVQTQRDGSVTDADWGGTSPGELSGSPITSRDAYLYTYTFTNDGTDSGLGEYVPIYEPLVGAALNPIFPGITPATSSGRRALCAFSDTEIGAAGTLTAAAWGPDSNVTRAASYPRMILRCGLQTDNSMSLGPSFSGNYQGNPTILFDGEYQVQQSSNVGNTPGQPAVAHIGGYDVTGPGTACWPAGGLPNMNYNRPLFDFTGWYSWPEFTAFFDWDPGDPNIEGDSIFLFDVDVAEGDTWQDIRGWYAVERPCSTTGIDGMPTRASITTHQGDTASTGYPVDTIVDARFTITRRRSTAQSLFYGPPEIPAQFGGETYGTASNYLPVQLTPAIQKGGAQIVMEFQGASSIQPDRMTVNPAAPFTDWTQNINDCDGFPFIRWRATLTSNLVSGTIPKIFTVVIPIAEVTGP